MPRAMALRDPPDAPAEPICGIPAVPATPTTGCFETGSVIPDVPAPAGRSVDPLYQPRLVTRGTPRWVPRPSPPRCGLRAREAVRV
jgi:hypothetical protein